MKRILLTLTMLGLLFPLLPNAQAQGETSLNFFYDNLGAQGSWIEVADYGYCFQPNVAARNPNWRPYTDGYWAYTDVGWTWISYEDFGWATYHYGRWTRLADLGWVWVPGYEWGPAWVSWRTGGDYVGWAPLPPAADRVYEGRAITGHVDVEFDIGPLYYNFVDIRYIGEPVLTQRIIEPQRNVTIINRTVNITNITYNNSVVYNKGPDVTMVDRYSTRPIPQLKLQRETTVNTNLTVQGGGGNLNRVNGRELVVVAPTIQRTAQKVAPRQVKTKIAQPKVLHGWDGVADRAKLQQAMKTENAQNVPPPSFQPSKGAGKANAGTAETASNGGNAGARENAGPGVARGGNVDQPAAGAAQTADQTGVDQTARQAGQAGRATRRGIRPGRDQAPPATDMNAGPGAAANQGQARPTPRHGRRNRQQPPAAQEQASPESNPQDQRGQSAGQGPTGEQGQPADQSQRRRARRGAGAGAEQPQPAAPAAESPNDQSAAGQGAGESPAGPRHRARAAQRQQTRPGAENPAAGDQAQQPQEADRSDRARGARNANQDQSAQPGEAAGRAQQGEAAAPGRGSQGEAAARQRGAQGAGSPAGESQNAGQHRKGKKKQPAAEASPTP